MSEDGKEWFDGSIAPLSTKWVRGGSVGLSEVGEGSVTVLSTEEGEEWFDGSIVPLSTEGVRGGSAGLSEVGVGLVEPSSAEASGGGVGWKSEGEAWSVLTLVWSGETGRSTGRLGSGVVGSAGFEGASGSGEISVAVGVGIESGVGPVRLGLSGEVSAGVGRSGLGRLSGMDESAELVCSASAKATAGAVGLESVVSEGVSEELSDCSDASLSSEGVVGGGVGLSEVGVGVGSEGGGGFDSEVGGVSESVPVGVCVGVVAG